VNPGWLLRAHYTWQHSPDPRLIGLHSVLDARLSRTACAVSTAGPLAPSIGYAGVPDGLVRIHELLEDRQEALAAAPSQRTLSTVHRRALLGGRALPPADLVAVGCTPEQAARLPGGAALVLPYRLHLVVDLSDGWRRRISSREREWLSSQRRKRDWGWQQATDPAAFDHFYDRMHLPTMDRRHGARTRSEPRGTAYQCLFRDGLLGFVTLDGVRVAGALCHRDTRRSTLTLRLLGVLGGEQRHYAEGALRMCYHLLLEAAERAGMRHLDFGGTESWLSKGIFQWKRKLGPRVVPAPNHLGALRVWWHARRDTPAVRDFLVANPVLEPAGAGLRAVYFHDEQRPARLDLAYRCANVTGLRTAHLDDFLAGIPGRRMERIGAP
jgi:hypothetical protein